MFDLISSFDFSQYKFIVNLMAANKLEQGQHQTAKAPVRNVPPVHR